MSNQEFRFNPYSDEMDADPFPYYKTLREEYPCFWSEDVGMWILSRYDDVKNATTEWETYSSTQGNLMDELPGRAGSTLGSTDPPRHDRLRRLIQSAFSKKILNSLTGPAMTIINECLDECIEKGEFEFVQDFSSRITVGTLFHMMGLPDEDHTEVRKNVILSIQSDKETRQKAPEHLEGFRKLVQYVEEQVEIRRKNPTDDLISRMVKAEIDGDKLKESEIIMTSTTLIIAGVESLSSFLSMMALNLHDFPDARRRIHDNPELVGPAIEESLRYNTSAQRFRRVLMKDTELHGSKMKKGDFVALCYGSANRDHRHFSNPDVYDIERRPRTHLGLGGGVHLCLGNMIARHVTNLAMTEYVKRIPEYYLTTNELKWNPSTTFRSPIALPFSINRPKK